MNKRNISLVSVAIIVILVVGYTVIVWQPWIPQTIPVIRYGGQYYPDEFLLYGLGSDLWEKYSVEVEHTLFSSAVESNEALIAGTIDINCGADTRTVTLFTAIPDQALIIGTVERGNRYTTVVKVDSPYQSWNDLIGKKIGIKKGTGAEGVLRKYFVQEGFLWEQFQWIDMNVENMIAYLEAGTIDAFHAWEPTPAIAETNGIARVLRTYGDIALVPASIATTKNFAYSNRTAVVRFLAAHMEKAAMIEDDMDNAATIAANAAAEKGITVSSEAFKKSFQRIDFTVEFDETIINAINETALFLYQQNKIDSIPQLVWDTSFVQEAKQLYQQMVQERIAPTVSGVSTINTSLLSALNNDNNVISAVKQLKERSGHNASYFIGT